MAIRAIIFRDDNDLPILQPFYFAEVQRGTLDIVGYAFEENGKINVVNSRDDVDPRQFLCWDPLCREHVPTNSANQLAKYHRRFVPTYTFFLHQKVQLTLLFFVYYYT